LLTSLNNDSSLPPAKGKKKKGKKKKGKKKTPKKKKSKKKGKACVPKAVDIVILVDTSNYVGKKTLKNVGSFMKKFISESPKGSLEPRFSIIQYSKRTRPLAWFKQCINKAKCASIAMKKIKFGGGQALMGKALKYAVRYAFRASRKIRKGTRRAILVINGGKSKDKLKTMAAADKAFKLKKPVYSLTVGDKPDKKLLQHISPGRRQFVIPATKLQKSKKVMTWLKMIYTGCPVSIDFTIGTVCRYAVLRFWVLLPTAQQSWSIHSQTKLDSKLEFRDSKFDFFLF
jgi:hypothetical protein